MITITLSLGMYSVAHFGKLLFKRKCNKNGKMDTHDILIGLILLILVYMTITNSMATVAPSLVTTHCGENQTGLHNWLDTIETDLSTY